MIDNIKKWVISTIIAILIWQLFSLLNIFNPIYFASPIEVLLELKSMFNNGSILRDITYTLKRVLLWLAISVIIWVPIWVLLWYFKRAHKYSAWIIDFFRSIPPIVFYPLLLISLWWWDISRISVAILWAVVVIILITSKWLAFESNLKLNYFKAIWASNYDVVKNIIVYQALPHIMTSIRTSASLIIIIIIVTEMLVWAKYWLWTRVQNVQITSNIPDLFATIIIIWLLWVWLNRILIFIEEKMIYWK